MQRPDQFIFDYLNLAQGPLANEVLANWMRLVTPLGSGFVLILVSAVVCIFLAERQQYRRAVIWFVAVAAVFLLSAFLKQLFFAARPDVSFHLAQVSSPSFPSEHALRSAFVYPGAVLALRSAHRFSSITFLILAIILAGVIGLSRVMLGVHWPVDVLAGWAVGGGAVVILWYQVNAAFSSPRN